MHPRAALGYWESGVWRLPELRARAQESARTSRASTLRALLVWGAVIVLLGGIVTLSAIALIEIAERLVELGGGVRRSASD